MGTRDAEWSLRDERWRDEREFLKRLSEDGIVIEEKREDLTPSPTAQYVDKPS